MLVRFDEGTTSPVGSPAEEAVAGTLVEAFASADAVVVSDYGYGVLTPRVIATLARLQAAGPRLLAVDVPAAVADVEEYLVSGIQPEQLRWIDACSSD